MKKRKVFLSVSYFIPGEKSGGPRKSIINLIDALSNEFEFWVVTRNHDVGDVNSYDGIKINQWYDYEKGHHISYIDNSLSSMVFLYNEIKGGCFDLIYLNSFFDQLTTIKIVAMKTAAKVDAPILIAPRGEFSQGAMNIKRTRKNLYLKLWGASKISNVYYHASTVYEKKDIVRELLCGNDKIKVAINLPKKFDVREDFDERVDPVLRLVYISRIVRKKNLSYCLDVLSKVNCDVVFDIYGPIEDEVYWRECQEKIRKINKNVACEYKGELSPSSVSIVFSEYDALFFPTLGENYGHVIVESLSVGTKVILSDQTPWLDLESRGIGWSIPLDNIDKYVEVIESMSGSSVWLTSKDRNRVIKELNMLVDYDGAVEDHYNVFNNLCCE